MTRSRLALIKLLFKGLCLSLSLLCACDAQEEPPRDPLPELVMAEPVVVSGALLGVWGEPSGERVWMVGGRVEADGSSKRHIALYERGEGEGAGRLRLHSALDGAPLWWVWGQAQAEGQAEDQTEPQAHLWASGEGGAILALNPETGAWAEERVELEGELKEKAIIWGVWGAGERVWAVGGSYRRGGPRGLLLKRELDEVGEAVWRRVSHPMLPTERADDPTAGLNLFKLWGDGEGGPVWMVGEGGFTLLWPQGLSGEPVQVEPAPGGGAAELLFTVHGAQGALAPLVVGGYAEALAWRWLGEPTGEGSWERLSLPAGTPPLNGVSVAGEWAHLVGARGVITRFWLGEPSRYSAQALTTRVQGAEAYTLHAAWSVSSQGEGEAQRDAQGNPQGEAPPATLFVVGGDLERRDEGVILTTLSTPLSVEPW